MKLRKKRLYKKKTFGEGENFLPSPLLSPLAFASESKRGNEEKKESEDQI